MNSWQSTLNGEAVDMVKGPRGVGSLSKCVELSSQIWSELLSKVDTVLFDADGVLWHDMVAIPGAADAVKKIEQMENIVTTSAVLAEHLKNIDFQRKIYVIGSHGIGDELTALGLSHIGIGEDNYSGSLAPLAHKLDPEVGAVVVGFDGYISYPKMTLACTYLRNPDCLFIATNDDKTFPGSPNGLAVPGTGAVLAGVEVASERAPMILGKPHRSILDFISRQIGPIDPARTLMVGDRCRTDTKFANDNGMHSLFVLTGDQTLDHIKEFHAQGKQDLVPEYYANSLGDTLSL